MKWQYFKAYCSVKREGLLGYKGYRVLNIEGQEYELVEGLNFLGQQEWELVAVHQLDEASGGSVGGIRDLKYLYLFKNHSLYRVAARVAYATKLDNLFSGNS